MIDRKNLRGLEKDRLLRDFSNLVDRDRHNTATLIAYLAEIDRRKLYLEHAYPSMFAFCTKRFHMSEAVAARRIRTGRATCRFPCILEMIARGEIHLTGVHLLAAHLTEENYREVLARARYKSTREIEKLIAEIAPKPDVPSSIRALPRRGASVSLPRREPSSAAESGRADERPSMGLEPKERLKQRPVPLSPRRYRLQVTIGQETRDKLEEAQGLLSHQIPDGDASKVLDRALSLLLADLKKKKAALTEKPGRPRGTVTNGTRSIPAPVRREVFRRDEGRCAFVDASGRRCGSRWQVEFHHRIPFSQGGAHEPENIELRCRAHNQFEAELDFGTELMEARRARAG